ncbi:phospholipid-transporting ATPase ABCA3-like [Amblyomma americanum]
MHLLSVSIPGSGNDNSRPSRINGCPYIRFWPGFELGDTEAQFRERYLVPMFSDRRQYYFKRVQGTADVGERLLEYAKLKLFIYVFNTHFGFQMTKATGNMLWYNGQIQHTALLTMSAYNDARLRNVTAVADAQFTFDVTAPPRAKVRSGVIRATGAESDDESEHIRSQNTYRVLLPKVLRSVFFPLVSSFMCSNFVLFPIAERALQVKQLHLLTGMSILLYWTLNFIFDFLFYMGTALMVLPPLAYFEELSGTDFRLIFVLNLLHGYAALPFIYIASFLFDNPGYGFTALSILMFVIASVGCLGEVFMEHYASQVNSAFVSAVIGTARQVVRLLPSCSYSRGMTKILQLASENRVCQIGGAELESQCTSTVAEAKLSIQRCCDHIGSPDRTEYVINPFDVHPYSAFYEVVTLSVEGAVLFGVLLFIERWVRKVDQALSSLEPEAYAEDMGQTMVKLPRGLFGDVAGSKKVLILPKKQVETEVMMEDELVDALVRGQMAPQTRPLLLVRRLHKAYGYSEPNLVLQGLTFTVRKGECFGLLGANGAGKTTTFRILTGELLPHAGDAYIGPFSVVNETEDFQRNLGYCPQRDGLLDMLTGVETLTLFIRLRGIEMTQAYMAALLEIFRLEEIAEQQVGKYSAGNRRKLSLCVSMLGMPSVVLLDEPYAGVASTARRRIVNYVSELQRISKISIVLTSHCLSDVEFLCNRIAILNDGRLQCLGTLTQLKEKFGKGYAITVKTFPDRKQDVVYQRDVAREVVKNFSQAELVYTYEGVLEFRMSRVRMPWSEMFTKMAKIKKRFKLLDFFISDTSLEQIFRSVTRKEAIESAAAAQAPQVPVAGHTIATTLGI